MEAVLVNITTALKTIDEGLSQLDKDYDKGQNKDKQNVMIGGLRKHLGTITTNFSHLLDQLKGTRALNCELGDKASKQARENRDQLDELEQRSNMGKIAVNIQDPELKKDIGIIETGDYSHFSLQKLITAINKRYSLSIDSEQDIQSARRVSRSGTIVILFFDHRFGSKYFDLVSAIKTKGNNAKGKSLYCNFVLTHRRNALLYQVRKAFKNEKLDKYYSDFDGTITLQIKGAPGKVKITAVSNKANNFILTTHTVEELCFLLGQDPQ